MEWGFPAPAGSEIPCCSTTILPFTRGQHQSKSKSKCSRRRQTETVGGIEAAEETSRINSPTPAATSSCCNVNPALISVSVFVFFLLYFSVLLGCPQVQATPTSTSPHDFNQTRHKKLNYIRAHLKNINRPPVKTIQSPDGDIIDCVLSHQQPAFDHPRLKGQKPIMLDPPERPKGHLSGAVEEEQFEFHQFQAWSMSGECCPEGTIPIRRTSEEDVLRASSIRRFGRKAIRRPVIRRDSSGYGHEHAVGYVSGNEYYGAKASINVWAPRVANQYEFSLSQIWVIAGSFANDLNTIEAGWQVSPELYGDNHPRFFTYWTTDAYEATGCYNLLCSGFVQTNNRIAVGAAISPISAYRGGQFDISLLVWKDPKHGHWWLELGNGRGGVLVGYWPALLFTHLRRGHATMIQFGGEIINSSSRGRRRRRRRARMNNAIRSSSAAAAASMHTTTQMGSGHFAGEGFGRASYFRNVQVVDWGNSLIPASNLRLLADHPNCYSIRGGMNRVWGNYFYYGGPGRNPRCP
ncbi:uncharacterized protein LOC127260871 [Andrographis paniculata]|uniref:uncharacterized protein LOC127260871 n=1 Tax=Andrographis paniculata TaxID=175694 RepID=UPI0021E75524|nr:uncharacterized protein LOC127260871 [Andrographis paniculata]